MKQHITIILLVSEVRNMKKDRIKKNIVSPYYLIVRRIVLSLIMVGAIVIVAMMLADTIVPLILTYVVLIGAYFAGIFYYLPVCYNNCKYYLFEDHIVIRKGFFIVKESRVDYSKVHYSVISQGIVQRRFGVCTVALMMAGSKQMVSNIAVKDARLLKHLEERSKKDG